MGAAATLLEVVATVKRKEHRSSRSSLLQISPPVFSFFLLIPFWRKGLLFLPRLFSGFLLFSPFLFPSTSIHGWILGMSFSGGFWLSLGSLLLPSHLCKTRVSYNLVKDMCHCRLVMRTQH